MKFLASLPFSILFISTHAFAQGCPVGQYQIGGQGAVACAPIPQDGAIQQESRPLGKWIKTWGAIATDGADNLGVSTGKLKKSEAEQDALEKCEGASKKHCEIRTSYENQCAAVAEPVRRGDFVRGYASGPSIEVASSDALTVCKKGNPRDKCQVIYQECSEPIFKAY
ncbi:TPA: DUF4189 domain-containing protein [Xanthomonas vasicola pv. zeae]|uniref:DUF4189 domain-containing protein n=1 Tax=Xanthomonas vasicola TaxID=56459 RepID=UPI000E3204D5|nr:DUF4189 domain-containing protein [Xanthomonas vasicola]HHZ21868.1 DUF4189 domain-containing protein [Xanthomonas vasicola pv. zeae]HHZ25562.1 DUF4189 domain-containing protein [Xanthomonas vasicola pv. zeae]HHZ33921.1 DUF4189 domain-containing protein [Xanthomonas vasicola pv. zeae]HHZ37732.1 DUF4189 domain-containing protein [Xanthomonas vasicola pv. zeae]HHZ42022.1 DUF4189 domain-containing protein [Xanthomonas vasicola pv. zeae]